MRHRVNEGCKVLGALKGVMKNRGLGMNVKKVLYEKVVVPTVMYGSESWGMKVTERQKLNVCSDRILTCRIKSIRSPAKVGLVVTDLITSPVVSWEGWETPPPPSTAALLSFFAQPPAWEDLSLLW